MNRGLVNLAELRNNFANADFKDGTTSYGFIRDGKVIKIYANRYDDRLIPREICDFSKYFADTIVFPSEYIYENGVKVGEIAPYINSKSIDKSFNDKAKVDKIIDSYELVMQDMQLYRNIWMSDLGYTNILYSNRNGFHIIDTTEWVFTKNGLANNVNRFNIALIDVLLNYLDIYYKQSKYYSTIDEELCNNLDKFGPSGQKLKEKLTLLKYNGKDFLSILFAYMDLYQKYYGNNMETLKDMKEMTKVLKKS